MINYEIVEDLVKTELCKMGLTKTDKFFTTYWYKNSDGRYKITSPFAKIRDEIEPTMNMADFTYKSNLTEKDFTWDYDEYWTDYNDSMICSYRLPTTQEKQDIVDEENSRREDEAYTKEYQKRLSKAIAIRIAQDIQEEEKEFQRRLAEWKRINLETESSFKKDEDNEEDDDDIF